MTLTAAVGAAAKHAATSVDFTVLETQASSEYQTVTLRSRSCWVRSFRSRFLIYGRTGAGRSLDIAKVWHSGEGKRVTHREQLPNVPTVGPRRLEQLIILQSNQRLPLMGEQKVVPSGLGFSTGSRGPGLRTRSVCHWRQNYVRTRETKSNRDNITTPPPPPEARPQRQMTIIDQQCFVTVLTSA